MPSVTDDQMTTLINGYGITGSLADRQRKFVFENTLAGNMSNPSDPNHLRSRNDMLKFSGLSKYNPIPAVILPQLF